MIIDKKFGIDENSTPPINYIGLKEGKAGEYNKNLNKGKVLDTLNAENFIQVFNSSTEEEKNAIKEALGIPCGEGQSSEDSDVVHYSDYHLFDWDDSKEGMQLADESTYTYYFYPEPEMVKKRSLFGSGCFVNINTQREYLFESDGDYKLYGNTTFPVAIIFLVEEGVNLPAPVPDGLIEGDGYVIVVKNGGGK